MRIFLLEKNISSFFFISANSAAVCIGGVFVVEWLKRLTAES